MGNPRKFNWLLRLQHGLLHHPHLDPFETLFPLWIWKGRQGEDSLCLILSNTSQLTGIFTFEYPSFSGGIKNATTPQGNFQVSIISTRLLKQRIDKVNYVIIIMLSCSVYIVIATVPRDSITHNAFRQKSWSWNIHLLLRDIADTDTKLVRYWYTSLQRSKRKSSASKATSFPRYTICISTFVSLS